MSKRDFISNLIYVKNRFRQIHFECSQKKPTYFPGLCNVLPKGSNTSEKSMTSSRQKFAPTSRKILLRNQKRV